MRTKITGRFATAGGEVDVGTGTPPEGPPERRVFRLDGAVPRGHAEVAAHVAFTILTCYVLQGIAPTRGKPAPSRRAA